MITVGKEKIPWKEGMTVAQVHRCWKRLRTVINMP
jgi:hypothetical protein